MIFIRTLLLSLIVVAIEPAFSEDKNFTMNLNKYTCKYQPSDLQLRVYIPFPKNYKGKTYAKVTFTDKQIKGIPDSLKGHQVLITIKVEKQASLCPKSCPPKDFEGVEGKCTPFCPYDRWADAKPGGTLKIGPCKK